MNRRQILWLMTAEQFAAFDTQLYLDTHPDDITAMRMINKYHNNFEEYKKQFEAAFGPISSDSAVVCDKWTWVDDPWPWEMEAN